MIDIIKTETFERWLLGLKDRLARFRIQARIDRLAVGNAGDFRVLRDGISELRIDHGPGYRVYFMRRGPVLIVILAGGDKRTQDADIEQAIAIASEWKE
jgi:putative addiction module killer protein